MRLAILFSIFLFGSLHAEGLPNPSSRPDCLTRAVDIFADFLYWYTAETVDWAFTLESTPNTLKTEYKTFTFDWAPGFRVGAGYNMKHDQWDTQASYTWFKSKAVAHTSGSVTSAFLAARLSLLEPFSTGRASLNLRYDIFDWDLGRSFLVSDYLVLRPAIGFKGGWINQFIDSFWTIPNFINLFLFAAEENLKHRFSGAGPKGGVSMKWCFGDIQEHAFSIIGLFETGYLWGHWKIKDRFIDNLLTQILIKTSERNFGALVLHSSLGFGWDCNFNHDRNHIGFKLAYEIEDWFNHFQIFSDTSGSQNNDLILQGFNFLLRYDF